MKRVEWAENNGIEFKWAIRDAWVSYYKVNGLFSYLLYRL